MPNHSLTPLHRAWENGDAVFGGWCIIPNTFSAEVLAQRGFDWVALDWQHGSFDLETTAALLQVISLGGAAPLVRVTSNEPWIIMKVLDMGAFGVIVPLVNNRAEAERAVAACRYPPLGTRSYGPVRNAAIIGTESDAANERIVCFVMIETAEGLANVDDICQTPGLTGLYIGPDDLRLSLGRPKGEPDPTALDRILAAAQRHNVICGIHAADGKQASEMRERGFRFVGIGSDADFLADAARDAVELARAGRPLAAEPDAEMIVRAVVWSGL